MRRHPLLTIVIALVLLGAIGVGVYAHSEKATLPLTAGIGAAPQLPPPDERMIPTVKISPARGWSANAGPAAGDGLRAASFADKLDHPRWLYVLPNGDVLVAETNAPPKPEDGKGIKGFIYKEVQKAAGAGVPSANRITLLRDADGDGVAETRSVFLQGLNSPFGMALIGRDFYVANADALMRFPYEEGQTAITAPGTKVVDLPGGPINHHWTKNVVASPDGQFLYVTVGSNSNVGENGVEAEEGRAAIWEVEPQTGEHRIFASGLRNPNGLSFEPTTGALWAAVNERDELGSDLVPDYMTAVRDGGFYGWPYSYYGQHVDARVQPPRPDLVAKAIVPDYALGPHTASLGLAFAQAGRLPASLTNGAFVGQHGSWNRRPQSGYKVIFVPFENGRPSGEPVDVLTGFLDTDGHALGRPVGVAMDKQGALLVADDVGNHVWRVTGNPASAAATR
jgi:hypothetical protein